MAQGSKKENAPHMAWAPPLGSELAASERQGAGTPSGTPRGEFHGWFMGDQVSNNYPSKMSIPMVGWGIKLVIHRALHVNIAITGKPHPLPSWWW